MQRPAFHPGSLAVALLVLAFGVAEILMPEHCDAGTRVPAASHAPENACNGPAESQDKFRDP